MLAFQRCTSARTLCCSMCLQRVLQRLQTGMTFDCSGYRCVDLIDEDVGIPQLTYRACHDLRVLVQLSHGMPIDKRLEGAECASQAAQSSADEHPRGHPLPAPPRDSP